MSENIFVLIYNLAKHLILTWNLFFSEFWKQYSIMMLKI